MEELQDEDELDQWFLESLKTYKDLYVYQLESPTQVIEWTSGTNVCVAGSSSSRNEILELRLPLKLFAVHNKGLCAERDFKVVQGGFTDAPVHCLRHIPGTRCLVSSDGRSSELQLWELGGDDSDVLRKAGSVPAPPSVPGVPRMAARLSSEPQLLHGGCSRDVKLTQLSTAQTLYSLDGGSLDPLSCLQFLSDSVFLAGCSSGNVYVADVRSPAAPQLLAPPTSSSSGDGASPWWTAACLAPPAGGCRILRLCSSGLAVVSDLRDVGGAISQARLDGQSQHSSSSVSVSWAPALPGCFSVSGFSAGVVQIYDTAAWTMTSQEVKPLFEHRGHVVSSEGDAPLLVSAHVWHPDRPRTLLSAATDGSVHVWDWVDQSGGS